MELREFVRETLVQVIAGVEEAQAAVVESGATVAPSGQGHRDLQSLNRDIEFDVAVIAQEGKATKGGIGIAVGVLALGSQGASDHRNAITNRVKFSVPVALPTQNIGRQRGGSLGPVA